MDLIDAPIVDRSEYDSYNFKEANWMIFYLYLCGTIPYTFYIKYSQKIEEFNYHTLKDVSESDLTKIKDTIKNTVYSDEELEEVRKNLIKNFIYYLKFLKIIYVKMFYCKGIINLYLIIYTKNFSNTLFNIIVTCSSFIHLVNGIEPHENI